MGKSNLVFHTVSANSWTLRIWQDFIPGIRGYFQNPARKKILPVRSTKSRQKKIPAKIFWSSWQEFPCRTAGKNGPASKVPDC
jgi:hypothetical protein